MSLAEPATTQLVPLDSRSADIRRALTPDARTQLAYRVLPWALLPVMLFLSRDFGVTWDAELQQQYGEAVSRYFASGLRDASALTFQDLYLYGGLFDFLCVVVQPWIPADPYVVRHAINSVFGWVGILFCGRTANRLFGPGAGLLAMVLLTLAPRYFGDAMNNPKDIPFAAMSAVAFFYLSGARPTYPYFAWPDLAKLTIAIALAVDVRAGGLLFLPYAGLLLAALHVHERVVDTRRIMATAGRLAVVAAGALVLGTTFWPWAQAQPFVRPFEALSRFTLFNWGGSVLYRGRSILGTEVPWDYGLVYVAIATPLVVMYGALLSIPLLWRRAERRPVFGALWLAAFFPIAYVALRGSTLYDGLRQLLFIYPPLMVLAAAAWWMTLTSSRGAPRAIVVALLGIGMLEPLWFQLRNHPNQSVYFNQLVGGPRGAFGRFELDYWGNSILQALEWIADNHEPTARPVLVSSGQPFHVVRLDARRFRSIEFTEDVSQSHYHVVLLRHSPAELRILISQPNIIHVIRTTDGAPLCLILAAPRYGELN